MKLIIIIQNQDNLVIQLKNGRNVLSTLNLTINQNLDTLLIRAIDNLIAKNRIDRLSLKALEIRGNMRFGAVSSMVLRTIQSGLKI